MVFIREKKKGLDSYYQVVETRRVSGKVRQSIIKHLGNRQKMLDYCKRHNLKPLPEDELIEEFIAKRIENKLKELNSKRPLPPHALESLNKKFEVEMTYNSNAIEGNRLTLRETFLVLEKGMTINGKSMREHLEVTNHKEALDLLEKIANSAHTIKEKDILDLHAVILDKIRTQDAGFYRHIQVYISGTPHIPPNYKEVPNEMQKVIYELNSKEQGVKAIESASKVHHLTTWIHPFIDGNGRLARLLTNLRLIRAGFPPIIVEKKQRKSYYITLEKADQGNLGPLTKLIANQTEKMLDQWLQATK